MNPGIFREYDIRGIVGEEILEKDALAIKNEIEADLKIIIEETE